MAFKSKHVYVYIVGIRIFIHFYFMIYMMDFFGKHTNISYCSMLTLLFPMIFCWAGNLVLPGQMPHIMWPFLLAPGWRTWVTCAMAFVSSRMSMWKCRKVRPVARNKDIHTGEKADTGIPSLKLTASSHLSIDGWKMKCLFGARPISRCHVRSGRVNPESSISRFNMFNSRVSHAYFTSKSTLI